MVVWRSRPVRSFILRDGKLLIGIGVGMLTNVLPKLVNLKNIYLSAPSESIVPVLRILQTTSTRLHGLSLQYVPSHLTQDRPRSFPYQLPRRTCRSLLP